MNTEQNTNQVEKPHQIKDFNAIAHDAMIRRMAQQVLNSNVSSQETVNAHVSEIRTKLKTKKVENNRFKQTINKITQLSEMARHCSAAAKVGA
jgi:hypothetical protein